MSLIIGIDEVGRGCIAGPVMAAAVVAPIEWSLAGITDSKLMTKRGREQFYQMITSKLQYAIGIASVIEIDEINILAATKLAMRRAYHNLAVPAKCYIDGNMTFPDWPGSYESVVKGDLKMPVISAAAIVAKVTRDRLMAKLDGEYSGYGWAQNAGYPTKAHKSALDEYGVTEHHRRSFAPVKIALANASKANFKPNMA